MSIRVRAVYANGALIPLEPTGLNEQCEVTLEITNPRPLAEEAETEAAQSEGEPETFLAMIERVRSAVPPDA